MISGLKYKSIILCKIPFWPLKNQFNKTQIKLEGIMMTPRWETKQGFNKNYR